MPMRAAISTLPRLSRLTIDSETRWSRAMRRAPLGWRIILIVIVNTVCITLVGGMLWRGTAEVTSSWASLNRNALARSRTGSSVRSASFSAARK
jgi:hypothetical protein